MGNVGSAGGNGRRRQGSRRSQTPPPPPPPMIAQPNVIANRYIFPGPPPLPGQYPNPNPNPNIPPGYYHQYPPPPPPGYYPHHQPALPMPMSVPYDHHHRVPHVDSSHAGWAAPGRCPYGPPPPPYVEHQKAMTIRNDVNLKKESLRVEKDEENPGKHLVAFKFDATAAGSMTVMFFAKEGDDCELKPLKDSLLPPVTVKFESGLGQKFRQPAGTGIDFSMFEESELLKVGEMEAYPLVVKAETHLPKETNTIGEKNNSQITHAIFEKDKGEYHVKVVKQILSVNGTRYELQEIYGIGNSVEGENDANDPGKECVICLSEPRDTTVLPCRHMCMCSGCAKVLRFQTNRCPICRQPVERLLEIKVGNDFDEG
ncbi:hypothetical protein V2J09_009497 [Rumex salicifolius]